MKKIFTFVSSVIIIGFATVNKNEKPQPIEMPRIAPVINFEELEFVEPGIDTTHLIYSKVEITNLGKK